MSDKCCLYRVPYILQRHNEKAYVPNAFSIGPWHHKKTRFKETQKIKLKYLKGLLSKAKRKPEDLVKAIAEIEQEARDCYAGPIDVSGDEFVEILVLDGCFMIELFRKHDNRELVEDDDPIFHMSCMLQYLYHDLILLENQIPWLVLECLFDLQTAPESKPLDELALQFFHIILPLTPSPMQKRCQGQKHLLDLLRNWLVLCSEKQEDGKWVAMPSASDLAGAGIKFKKGNTESILDIKFSINHGVLEIPPLLIQETTEVILRNLISYEQCHPKCSNKITSYAILLDNLINTTQDMDILTRDGIITNWLNPDDAIQFFNKLYHDAYLKSYCYMQLCQDVNKYRQRRWPRWRAILMSNYFSTPWAAVSIVVATAFLILAILQTIFTIIGK
ncbi:hypothetical protein Tsubulata_034071 [Turnera subulata]|uniref:Uncharacterized protein n=1 Tax=Turnera subulata TaxID=218843 RepID=A0A9Q0G3H4_9ROSI|nr:hypothetical protein Tsubulata_034071 [Turnera subulata]